MIAVSWDKWAVRAGCVLLIAAPCLAGDVGASSESSVSRVEANDNRRPAGSLTNGTLTLALRASMGRWQPEESSGPTLEIEAFGEIGQALTVPAPLIRVPEGTTIAVSIRNDLNAVLVVQGLCTRGGATCARFEVPPQQTRATQFASGPAGTYHYWASTIGAPVPFRELAGAFVVDSPATAAQPDRILVITEWTSLTAQQLSAIVSADTPTEVFVGFNPRLTFVINGLSWPATERFAYERGERVRWRVINVSSQPHPLHLHGFYFEVGSLGNGTRDTSFDDASRRLVVTQLLQPGATMTMTWVPERAGNWLFHCHVMHHVSLDRRLGDGRDAAPRAAGGPPEHHQHGDAGDVSSGMAGMVIGVTVHEPANGATASVTRDVQARKLTLLMQHLDRGPATASTLGFVLSEGGAPAAGAAAAPGPAIVLRRNEPVEITLVNRLAEATAVHWHGMELDSYYDGVHGWSGINRQVTPMIAPGASFVVRFTPPRAGTFMYHTHLHDYRQLSSGLYGPLIVTDRDETFDPDIDHVILLARSGLTSEAPSILTDPASVVINGERAPRLVWKAGGTHRVRLINITPDDIFTVSMHASDGPAQWTPVAKDGAPLPAGEVVAATARQTIAVGETYDFVFQTPPGRKTVWLEVRTPGGKWQAQGQVIIR